MPLIHQLEKQFDGHNNMTIIDGNFSPLSTSRDKHDELWSELEYYFQIEQGLNKILDLHNVRGKTIRAKTANQVSSYLIQARNFYRYARGSDYRSSALLYYYAFMNLAKAKLVLSNPTFLTTKMSHGIYADYNKRTLNDLAANAIISGSNNKTDVFTELYRLRMGVTPSTRRQLKVSTLLRYVSDVGRESMLVLNKPSKTAQVKYSIASSAQRQSCWPKIAVRQWHGYSAQPNAYSKFNNTFAKFDPNPLTTLIGFEFKNQGSMYYTFYESIQEFPLIGTSGLDTWSCDSLLRQTFGSRLQSNHFDPEMSFEINEPYAKNNYYEIDELLATYMIMFVLSNIVRYRPQMIDTIAASHAQDGWILKNFIESSPYTFLIRMASWLTNNHYMILDR